MVVLGDLLGLDFGEHPDGLEAGVLSQSHGDHLQRIGEGAESILLNRLDLKGTNCIVEHCYRENSHNSL